MSEVGTADIVMPRAFPRTGPISMADIYRGVMGFDSGAIPAFSLNERRVRDHPVKGPVDSGQISFNDMRGRICGLHKEHLRAPNLSYDPKPRWTQVSTTEFPNGGVWERRTDNPQNHNDSLGDYIYNSWNNGWATRSSINYDMAFWSPQGDGVGAGDTLRLEFEYTLEHNSPSPDSEQGIWVVMVRWPFDWGTAGGGQTTVFRQRVASLSDSDPKFKSARVDRTLTQADLNDPYWAYSIQTISAFGGSAITTKSRIANVRTTYL